MIYTSLYASMFGYPLPPLAAHRLHANSPLLQSTAWSGSAPTRVCATRIAAILAATLL